MFRPLVRRWPAMLLGPSHSDVVVELLTQPHLTHPASYTARACSTVAARSVRTATEAFHRGRRHAEATTISPIFVAQTSDGPDRSVVRRMSARNTFSPNDLLTNR